jgi:peptide/nickel transport system permease protein
MRIEWNAKNRVLVLLLLAVHLPVLFPGFFSPYDYATQDRNLPFAPPTRLHFVDDAGHFHCRPFVYGWKEAAGGDEGANYQESRAVRFPIHFFVRNAAEYSSNSESPRLHFFGAEQPGLIHLLGTDGFGRDVFSRMLFGGRISLAAGVFATCLALSLAISLGVISGFYGRWVDTIVMRGVDIFLALPWLCLLFAVRAVLPLHIRTTESFLLFVSIIGIVGWARPARLIRGLVLTAKERNFVLAARAFGASDFHILRRHILPQVSGTLLTLAALLIPQFLLAEVTLSFLGLGVGEPLPSLGNLLAELQKYSVLTSYWWMYCPAVALVALFMAYQWTAKAFQDEITEVTL